MLPNAAFLVEKLRLVVPEAILAVNASSAAKYVVGKLRVMCRMCGKSLLVWVVGVRRSGAIVRGGVVDLGTHARRYKPVSLNVLVPCPARS